MVLREGLNLRIKRVSLLRSSKLLVEEDKTLKSCGETGYPVSLSCDKILVGAGLARFFPVMAEMPKWSEIRVCRRRQVWPIYNKLHR